MYNINIGYDTDLYNTKKCYDCLFTNEYMEKKKLLEQCIVQRQSRRKRQKVQLAEIKAWIFDNHFLLFSKIRLHFKQKEEKKNQKEKYTQYFKCINVE